jgi:hypothetical protein
MPDIEFRIPVRLVKNGVHIPLPALFTYSASRPYEVRVAFLTGEPEPVTWTFGRDLLREGLERPSGPGDVHIAPSPYARSAYPLGLPERQLAMKVTSPHGDASFLMNWDEVAAFLNRTYNLVPAYSEGTHLDIDADLVALLGDPEL